MFDTTIVRYMQEQLEDNIPYWNVVNSLKKEYDLPQEELSFVIEDHAKYQKYVNYISNNISNYVDNYVKIIEQHIKNNYESDLRESFSIMKDMSPEYFRNEGHEYISLFVTSEYRGVNQDIDLLELLNIDYSAMTMEQLYNISEQVIEYIDNSLELSLVVHDIQAKFNAKYPRLGLYYRFGYYEGQICLTIGITACY